MGNIKCKTIWEQACFWNKPFSLKMGDFPDITERLKSPLGAQHVGGLSSPATPRYLLSRPLRSLLYCLLRFPKQPVLLKATTFGYLLSSLPICPPRQLGSAWVGPWKEPSTLTTLPAEWGCPAFCECSGKSGACLAGPPGWWVVKRVYTDDHSSGCPPAWGTAAAA